MLYRKQSLKTKKATNSTKYKNKRIYLDHRLNNSKLGKNSLYTKKSNIKEVRLLKMQNKKLLQLNLLIRKHKAAIMLPHTNKKKKAKLKSHKNRIKILIVRI